MVHGAVRGLFQFIGLLFAALLVALSFLAWRLSSGPVALSFLTPYIEDALSDPQNGFSTRLDTTVLALAPGSWAVEIQALNVRLFLGGEAPVAEVPEMALTLNGQALLAGELAPSAVRFYHPRLRLVRDEKGRFQWDVLSQKSSPSPSPSASAPPPQAASPQAVGQSDAFVAGLLDAVIGVPNPARPARHLQRVSVINADVRVDDLALGTSWHAPDGDIDIRRVPQGMQVLARLVLETRDGQGGMNLRLNYAKADGGLSGEMMMAGLRPSELAVLGGALAPLRAVDLPLAGSIQILGRADGTVQSIDFNLGGGAGQIVLEQPAPTRISVESLLLRGQLTDGLKTAHLDEAVVDLGGPRLTLSADAKGLGGATAITAEARLTDVPVDELGRLWPSFAAANPREWVLKNLSNGMARELKVSVTARSANGRFDDLMVERLAGEVAADGVSVDYLHPMPVVRNAATRATFDASAFRLALLGGEVYGLRITGGTIVLGGLDAVNQFADIDMTVDGPAADALRLVDSKPLRYASALGIDPAKVGGDATTRLSLKFPLLRNLRMDDLAVKAHSSLKAVSLPKVLLGQDLTRADLEVDVDAKGLDAQGAIVLGTIPGDLKWRENFSAKGVAFRSRYQVQVPKLDEDQRKVLGLTAMPFVSPVLAGPVGASVVAVLQDGGKGDIDINADLSPAHMTLPGMGWRKEERTTGGAQMLLRLDRGQIVAVPKFVVNAGDLQAQGAVAFGNDGAIRRVDFSRLAYGGRTDISGSVTFNPGGALDVTVKGDSINAEPFISSGEETPAEVDAAQARKKNGGKKEDGLPPMTITASLGQAWVSQDGRLLNVTANLNHDVKDWRGMDIRALLDNGKSFALTMRPDGPNRRAVTLVSDDAGGVLRTFDTYGDMMNGRLDVAAHYDDADPRQPLSGIIKVKDYQIVKAPALARLLTVAALTGILDVLKGDGVGFSTLDAPFTYADGLLAVHDVRAFGSALGITAKGQIDMDRGRMALEGTVVPAYALNSVLGNIPVLGWLITGGEKGGGLVAFNYSMKGPTGDPDVIVNPLSALTPGFLRNLFNIFDDGSGTNARKGPDPAPTANPANPADAGTGSMDR